MSHSETTNGIWTQEFVYRNSLTGKSEDFLVERVSSLQQGFDSDSQRCFPIAIHNLTTFALEQGIVGAVSISQSTAVATPFGSVPTIHNVQLNVIIKTPLLKNLLELIKRNTHNGSVESSSFWLEFLKLFDSNIGIIFNSKFDNLFNNLPEIGFNKISLIVFNPFKLLFSVQRLKQRSPFYNFSSLNPNLLSKICLVENFAIRRDDAESKIFGVGINSHNILSLWNFLLFRQVSNNLQIGSQPKSLAYPTTLNQILKSLIIPILFDWNSNSISWIQSEFNKEISLGLESLAVPRNVEFDSQTVNLIGFLSPYLPFDIANYLRIKRGVLFDN